jgi:hypothetical protein
MPPGRAIDFLERSDRYVLLDFWLVGDNMAPCQNAIEKDGGQKPAAERDRHEFSQH